MRFRDTVAGLVALTMLASLAGCGSRASDTEIAEALRGASVVAGVSGAAVPGVADPAASGPLAPTGPTVGTASAPSTGESAAATKPKANAPAASTTGGQKAASGGVKPATPAAANLSEIRIGMVGPFSGVFGSFTALGPKTLAAWVAHTNATGGVNGHPVRLLVGDDQGDPSTAITLVKRFVESDKILAFVGNLHAFGLAQIEQYLRAKNVPVVGGDGVDALWFNSPVLFPISTSASEQVIKGLQSFINTGSKKIGILYCVEIAALCSYMVEQVKKSEVGPYITSTYQISLVAPSYTSQCLRMKQEGIDTVYMLQDSAGAARTVRDCATQGFKPKFMLLGLNATPEVPTNASLRDLFIPGATQSPGAQNVAAIAEFTRGLATYAPGQGVSGVALLSWAAGEMFARVARDLPANPTSADVFAGLWNVRNESLGGLIVPVTYSKGKLPVAKRCVFIWTTAGGTWAQPANVAPSC